MKDPVLDLLAKIVSELADEFPTVRAAGDQAALKQLWDDYMVADTNFNRAINLVFDQNDAKVKELVDDIKAAEDTIDGMIGDLERIPDTLNEISVAVDKGTQLVEYVTGKGGAASAPAATKPGNG